MIILAYIGAVIAKQAYEILDWLESNRGSGPAVYWAGHKFDLGKRAFFHVVLCSLWVSGLLLGMTNGALTSLGAEPLAAVNWQSTIAAGWMLDTLVKPLAKRLKKAADE